MKRPIKYDKGQHELICSALGVSSDPDAPGHTAYEAVCVLLTKIDVAKHELKRYKNQRAKDALDLVSAPGDSEHFSLLQMY